MSKGWIGYCGRNGSFSINLCANIIDTFINYFKTDLNKVVIVTSFFKQSEGIVDDDPKTCEYIFPIEQELVDSGLLKEYSDELYNEGLKLSFSIINHEKECVRSFSFLAMADSRIFGHCFFILGDSGLIAYPHDDSGFGFISTAGLTNGKLAVDFLRQMAKVEGYSVQLNSFYATDSG